MLASGERPRRTIYIGLGHDEEVGGAQGAGHIAARLGALLQQHGETLDWLLDEGMTVMQVRVKYFSGCIQISLVHVCNNLQGVVPGLADPAIYIGVVEKGWAMLELSVQAEQKVRQRSEVGHITHCTSYLRKIAIKCPSTRARRRGTPPPGCWGPRCPGWSSTAPPHSSGPGPRQTP